jgi:RHS repeat-associated protein
VSTGEVGTAGQYSFNSAYSVNYGGAFGYYTEPNTRLDSSDPGYRGLVLCTYRYFDPSKARWLTRDPLGYGGAINLYAFVGGNPVTNADPSGFGGGGAEGPAEENEENEDGSNLIEDLLEIGEAIGRAIRGRSPIAEPRHLIPAFPFEAPEEYPAELGPISVMTARQIARESLRFERRIAAGLEAGGETIISADDREIAKLIGDPKGRAADILTETKGGTMHITEAKGTKTDDAVDQLEKTANGIARVMPDRNIRLSLAVRADRLKEGKALAPGYELRGNQLNWFDSKADRWRPRTVTINGKRITINVIVK